MRPKYRGSFDDARHLLLQQFGRLSRQQRLHALITMVDVTYRMKRRGRRVAPWRSIMRRRRSYGVPVALRRLAIGLLIIGLVAAWRAPAADAGADGYGPAWFVAMQLDDRFCQALAAAAATSADFCQDGHALAAPKTLVPGLVKLADHVDVEIRESAIAALASVGSSAAAPAVPVLTKRLKDLQWTTRMRAAIALGLIGARATAALDALDAASGADRHALVRYWATQAAAQIRQGASYEP